MQAAILAPFPLLLVCVHMCVQAYVHVSTVCVCVLVVLGGAADSVNTPEYVPSTLPLIVGCGHASGSHEVKDSIPDWCGRGEGRCSDLLNHGKEVSDSPVRYDVSGPCSGLRVKAVQLH